MGYCKQCRVEILDDTYVCPLCRGVLEDTGKHENMYPDIKTMEKKISLVIRIFVVAAIATEVLLIHINYITYNGVMWSLITGGAMLLTFLALKIVVEYEYGYRAKTITMVFFSLLYLILIDWVLGFHRWSLNYIYPAAILAMDALVLVLMIVNFRNWQSYIIWQIFTIFLGVCSVIMYRLNWVTKPLMGEIALAVSLLFFLGTVIIGGGRAVTELKRRFRV